jgi:hypothetical protein
MQILTLIRLKNGCIQNNRVGTLFLNLCSNKKGGIMPWSNGDYPISYKNQSKKIRDKATEIANEVLKTTGNEGEAIATGLKQARAHFANLKKKKDE